MKIILLAAGRSIRMQPVHDKNFLKFLGEPLIQHQLEALIKASFKEICVIGGKHNLNEIRKLLRTADLKNAKIVLREQKNLDLGMAGAVLSAASWIKNEPFVCASSNDVLDESAYEFFRKNLKEAEGLILAYKVSKYFPGGYLKLNSKRLIAKIVEKPGAGKEPSKLVNIVLHYHSQPKLLIEALKKTISADRDDKYEQALQILFSKGVVYKAAPFSGFWQPVKYPWHVILLMNHFLQSQKPEKGAGVMVDKSAVIKGNVYLADGVRVLENAVIVGPAYIGENTIIATNALVRESHIGANCVIGFGSEVARSYVGDNVWTHTNYIGDSIIGNDVSFGAGTATGNLRFDEKNVFVTVHGEKIDSETNKLGLITGDHIRTGINASFMPGVKIGSNSCVGAGITVSQDVAPNSFVTAEVKMKTYENKVKVEPRKKRGCHCER